MDPRKFQYDEPDEKPAFTLLPEGDCTWKIAEINQMTTSRNGNAMLPVKFTLTANGATSDVYENLVFTEKAAWKINQFLKSACGGKIDAGRIIDFESPDFIKWMMSTSGTAKVGIDTFIGRDGNERQKNVITEFTYPKTDSGKGGPPPVNNHAAPDVDDEIPF